MCQYRENFYVTACQFKEDFVLQSISRFVCHDIFKKFWKGGFVNAIDVRLVTNMCTPKQFLNLNQTQKLASLGPKKTRSPPNLNGYCIVTAQPHLNHNPKPSTTKSWMRHGNHQKTTHHHPPPHQKLKLHERMRVEQNLKKQKLLVYIHKAQKSFWIPPLPQK